MYLHICIFAYLFIFSVFYKYTNKSEYMRILLVLYKYIYCSILYNVYNFTYIMIHTIYICIYIFIFTYIHVCNKLIIQNKRIYIYIYVFCDTYPCTACVEVCVQKSYVQNQLVPTSPKN